MTPYRTKSDNLVIAFKGLKISGLCSAIFVLGILLYFILLNEFMLFDECILFIFMLILIGFPFMKAWENKTFDIFEPVNIFVCVFFLSFWVLPLLRYLDFDTFSLGYAINVGITREDMRFGLWITVIGLIFFYLGYYSNIATILGKLLPKVPVRLHKGNVAILVGACLAIGGILWLYFFKKGNFSIEYIYANRATIVIGDGMLYHVMVVSLYFASMVSFSYLIKKINGRFMKKLVYLIPAMTAIPFFIFGGREKMLIFLLVPFIIWHYTVHKLTLKKIAIGFLFAFVFIVLFGYFRAAGNLQFKDTKRLLLSEANAQFSYSEIALMVYKHYPELHGFYHGKLMAQDFLIFIPRAIWPGKPINYGSQLVQLDILPQLVDTETGYGSYEAFSPLGLGYAEFGIIGAAFAMFICGLVWRGIYEFFKRSDTRNPYSVMIFGLMIAMLPKIVGGFMGSIFNGIILWLIPLIILLKMAGIRAATTNKLHIQ